ncbi:MAG: TetR/AcrR family transcriptional regulator [Pseudomonadales bacterium]|nr:TetR/AcrR family transcriptional regulator [Pseudomonadales bacterium]
MIQRQKTTHKKNTILHAALGCYTEHGYANASVDMIKNEANASIGSIYHHFGNKEGIFAHLFMAGIKDHYENLIVALEQARSAEDAIRSMVCCFVDWVRDNPDWARFIFSERQIVINSSFKDELVTMNRDHFKSICAALEQYLLSGDIKTMPMDLYTSLIIGPAYHFTKHWLTGRASTTLDAAKDTLAESAWLSVKGI